MLRLLSGEYIVEKGPVMKHAIKTPPQHGTWSQFLELWQAADELSVFESAWNWDHFYPLTPPFTGPNFEGWTMLGALAQATTRIRIGSMVNGMHHRHPAITANMAATLDHISGGRFELGIGAGWNELESASYGITLGDRRDRSDRLEEGLTVITSLLTETETDHRGRFFNLERAMCEPKPLQDRIPIVVGGKGRVRTLRTAAMFADQWDMTFPETPAQWLDLDAVLRQHCERLGRDSGDIKRSIHLLAPDDGDYGASIDNAQSFFDAGVDLVIWSWPGNLGADALSRFAAALAAG